MTKWKRSKKEAKTTKGCDQDLGRDDCAPFCLLVLLVQSRLFHIDAHPMLVGVDVLSKIAVADKAGGARTEESAADTATAWKEDERSYQLPGLWTLATSLAFTSLYNKGTAGRVKQIQQWTELGKSPGVRTAAQTAIIKMVSRVTGRRKAPSGQEGAWFDRTCQFSSVRGVKQSWTKLKTEERAMEGEQQNERIVEQKGQPKKTWKKRVIKRNARYNSKKTAIITAQMTQWESFNGNIAVVATKVAYLDFSVTLTSRTSTCGKRVPCQRASDLWSNRNFWSWPLNNSDESNIESQRQRQRRPKASTDHPTDLATLGLILRYQPSLRPCLHLKGQPRKHKNSKTLIPMIYERSSSAITTAWRDDHSRKPRRLQMGHKREVCAPSRVGMAL